MNKLRIFSILVGIIQLILGVLYLLAPQQLLHGMGHSAIAPDIAYPLGMLAARFLVYGVLMLTASRNLAAHRSLLIGMIWIQIIDFGVGAFYTIMGVLPLSLSGFPMFNAALITALLWLWLPAQTEKD